MLIKITISFTLLFFTFCQSGTEENVKVKETKINTSHLDDLYEEINVSGKTLGIIHIYSEYPDYKWVGDDDEGIACVDDAARELIFYLKHYQDNNNVESLKKVKQLIEFLLFMQSDNGLFYNFIFNDHSINKTHKNSVNQPDWWSWRAMWALSESFNVIRPINKELGDRILNSLVLVIKSFKDQRLSSKTKVYIDGIELPTWLPHKYSSDQAALIMLGLTNYYSDTSDSSVLPYLNDLCDGILMMQKGDSSNLPFYAILSWQNLWHAYGNSQSYALLKALSILKRDDIKNAALNEVNHFYDYLIKENYLNYYTLAKVDNSFTFLSKQNLPQIAYDIRPMVYACLEAYKITQDSIYAEKAGTIATWFWGNNIADKQMYFSTSGVCYDGIISTTEVNKNSGAESTIEALLSLQAVEKNSISSTIIRSYYKSDNDESSK